MEFLKRKHFSLWITTTFIIITTIVLNVSPVQGLQGVPTWIALGLKSPFIEFRNDLEMLANNSIPLNITKDEQALMHQEGLRKLGTFIKPVDLRDSETGFVKANLTKKLIPSTSQGIQNQKRIHPIQEEMDQKQIVLLDEDTDENGLPASLTDEDRKFIVPMALKNSQPDSIYTQVAARSSMLSATTKATVPSIAVTKKPTTQATPEFASNIEDLKKHILFLQNLTKHDSNFQSKFVVFPSLQKDKQKVPHTLPTTLMPKVPIRPIHQYSVPTHKVSLNVNSKVAQMPPYGGYYHNQDDEDSLSVFLQPVSAKDKIAVIPQVLLLNDQTKDSQGRKTNNNMAISSSTATVVTISTSTSSTTRRPAKPTKLPPCVRNPESPKCIRQRKREEQQRQRDREALLKEQEKYMPRYEPYMQTLNNTKRFAVSIEIPDSFKIPLNKSDSDVSRGENSLQIISRFIRSTHKRRNIGGGLPGRSTSLNDKFSSKYGASAFLEHDSMVTANGGREFLVSDSEQLAIVTPNATTATPTVAAYSEPIDLNPDNCYLVDGMTYGQKKQCVLHTSVMPAISRGARATIQECQFQFKNRRWNCTTIDDNTVFGPITGLGSPEMAFIHALSAATVTSFIARACRDGQLASCGCSSGSRPKQLHDDWSWGGCGDNLEYAYKFATDFIDIREKETKRGTRGVGNPEKHTRSGRLHQKRLQKLHQQQQMLSDDASIPPTFLQKNETMTTSKQEKHQQQYGVQYNKNNENYKSSNKTSSSSSSDSAVLVSSGFKSLVNISTNSTQTQITAGATTENTIGNINTGTNKIFMASNTSGSHMTHSLVTQQIKQQLPSTIRSSSVAPPRQEESSEEYMDSGGGVRIKPEDLLELQERITKEILNSKLQEKEMLELQEKINREILNSKVFNMDTYNSQSGSKRKKRRKNQRAVNVMLADVGGFSNNPSASVGNNGGSSNSGNGKWKNGFSVKARSLINLHNNEAGRRAVIKKTRITCKCHGVSGSCSLITCWQQLSSIREIGDYLREKYEESTEVKLNKRGRLQVKDHQFKVPTAHDLVYLDESPDWCRSNKQLQWSGTHSRVCNKTSSGLDGCGILCCGRGYNTKNIVVRERCNCKFHWCCQVKCDVCVKIIEEHTCK